jgi:hypothetical protein
MAKEMVCGINNYILWALPSVGDLLLPLCQYPNTNHHMVESITAIGFSLTVLPTLLFSQGSSLASGRGLTRMTGFFAIYFLKRDCLKLTLISD